jgi:hypothetical protein
MLTSVVAASLNGESELREGPADPEGRPVHKAGLAGRDSR